jgi:hypothetical protein
MAGEAVSTAGDSVMRGVSDAAGSAAEASGVVCGVASIVVVATADGVDAEEGLAVDGLVDAVVTGCSADASGVGVAVSTGEGVAAGEGVSATDGDGSLVVEALAFDCVAAGEGEFFGDSATTAGTGATVAGDDAGEPSVVAAAVGAASGTLFVRRSRGALVAGIVISFIDGRG